MVPLSCRLGALEYLRDGASLLDNTAQCRCHSETHHVVATRFIVQHNFQAAHFSTDNCNAVQIVQHLFVVSLSKPGSVRPLSSSKQVCTSIIISFFRQYSLFYCGFVVVFQHSFSLPTCRSDNSTYCTRIISQVVIVKASLAEVNKPTKLEWNTTCGH